MRQKHWFAFAVLVLIAFAGGSWWATQPRLLAVEPEPNATAVPGSASLRLSFSHLMQPESVLQRLSIQPPLPGNFHWEGKTLVFTPARAWPGGLTVRVRLSRGAQTQAIPHRRLTDAVEWWFQIGYPKVLYLFPFDGPAGLYLLDPFTATVERLSESGQEVFDYSLSANGATLLLTVREGNGSAIYRRENHSGQVERLLFFPHGQVRAAQLSHSGTYLAYELTELKEANAKTHVWVTAYPPQAEDQATRLGASDQLTRSPLWSAQDLLAYYDHTNRCYRFFDPATQSEVDTIQAETGEKAAWSPDGEMFLFAEILPQAGQYPTSHLLVYHLPSRQLRDLSERTDVEDLGGVFSPQGNRLVFGRKFLDALQWTPGRQPWLLDLESGKVRPLLSNAVYNHYDFVWSPNGDQILFVRFDQMSLTEPPEVWLMDANGSQPRQLVKGGFAPQWMP